MSYKNTISTWWKSLIQSKKEKVHNNHSGDQIKQLVTNEEIEGTPFRLVGNKEKGYFIAFGKYKLTETEETKTAATNKLTTNQWDVLTALITSCIEATEEYKQSQSKTK